MSDFDGLYDLDDEEETLATDYEDDYGNDIELACESDWQDKDWQDASPYSEEGDEWE